MHSVGSTLLVFLVLYFLITVAISRAVQRQATTGYLSFLIAGKRMPWWIIAFSAFATYEGATSFLAWPGQVWKSGVVIGWQIYATSMGVLVFSLFMIPILANMRRITLPEIFAERYGPTMRLIVAILSYSRLLGGGAIMLLGMADVLKTYFGLNVELGLLVALLIMGVYVTISGQYGVMYADVFQAVFTILSSFGAPIMLLLAVGHGSLAQGWAFTQRHLPPAHLDLMGGGQVSHAVIFGYIATWFFSQMLRPDLYGRIFSARTSKDGVLGWVAFATFAPIQQTGIIVAGLAGSVLVAHLSSPDLLMPTALGQYAPTWFAAIYSLGVISACTAVSAASFLGASSIYMADIHLTYINRNLSSRRIIWYTRIATVVFALVAAFWAYTDRSIITIISNALSVLIGGVLVPFFAMFFWARMTTVGAYLSSIGGGLAAVLFTMVFPKVQPLGMPGVIFAILVSLVLALVGSYATPAQTEAASRFAEAYGLAGMRKRLKLSGVGSPEPVTPGLN